MQMKMEKKSVKNIPHPAIVENQKNCLVKSVFCYYSLEAQY